MLVQAGMTWGEMCALWESEPPRGLAIVTIPHPPQKSDDLSEDRGMRNREHSMTVEDAFGLQPARNQQNVRVAYTAADAMSLLGLSKSAFKTYTRDGHIPCFKVSGRRYVPARYIYNRLRGNESEDWRCAVRCPNEREYSSQKG